MFTFIPMIEDEIEHETVDTSIITSSKPSEFSHADCGYAVAPYFSFSSESMIFFTIVHQVISSISSFSECLELFSDVGHIFIDSSDIISLVVSDVRPSRKTHISLCHIFRAFT